jgi:hypothetical protein
VEADFLFDGLYEQKGPVIMDCRPTKQKQSQENKGREK